MKTFVEYVECCATIDDVRRIESLLRADPSAIGQTDCNGRTALHILAEKCDTSTIAPQLLEILFRSGANPEVPDKYDMCPLVIAVTRRVTPCSRRFVATLTALTQHKH